MTYYRGVWDAWNPLMSGTAAGALFGMGFGCTHTKSRFLSYIIILDLRSRLPTQLVSVEFGLDLFSVDVLLSPLRWLKLESATYSQKKRSSQSWKSRAILRNLSQSRSPRSLSCNSMCRNISRRSLETKQLKILPLLRKSRSHLFNHSASLCTFVSHSRASID
jgi:hypothetical protein